MRAARGAGRARRTPRGLKTKVHKLDPGEGRKSSVPAVISVGSLITQLFVGARASLLPPPHLRLTPRGSQPTLRALLLLLIGIPQLRRHFVILTY